MDSHQIDLLKSKTHIYSVVGDPVSETFTDYVVLPEKIYSSRIGFDKHSMAPLNILNATDLNTNYINSDNSINVANVSNAYNEIVAKESIIKAEMAASSSDSWLDYIKSSISDSIGGLVGITNFSKQLQDIAIEKAGLAEILKGAVTSFEGEIEFWSQEFSEYNTELAETLHLKRCLEPSMLFDATASQTESSILEFIGGENNKKILDNIVDSIKLQPTAEAQEQFVNSLENSGLLDKMLGSEATDSLGISTSLDSLIQDIAQTSASSKAGESRVFRQDPLTFDLDGDGIETVAADGSILFDANADGIKRGTGWVGADDGLLVRDLNGNGTIDSGREFFGDATLKSDGSMAQDGFDALLDLDSNKDGVFDSLDREYDSLQVWQDANQDGISESTELRSLADVGVESIDLNAMATSTATDGGVISNLSSYENAD